MKSKLLLTIALVGLAAALPSQATEINISAISLTPDGTTATEVLQTQINLLNDGGADVLPATNGTVVYLVTTYTFGAASDAHFTSRFNATGGQDRLGIEVQDTGLIQFVSTNDPGRTNVNLAQDMAGQTITLLVKQHYDASNDSLRTTLGTSDDTLMTVWVNPDNSDVEGSGLTAGDMQTLWNSATYRFFTHSIANQSTPSGAGTSSITNTVILTGADATFANALALATGGTPPTGIVDPGTSTVSASPLAVPADGASTSTVTVTLKESSGIPVAGKEVSLSGNGSATIETSNNTSDSGGVVTFTVKSNTVGTEQFTATDVTDGNLVITQTASVDFQQPVVVGPVDAGNSTVAVSSASVAANGVAISTITITLRDGNGLLIVGEGVTLNGSPSGATITPAGAQSTDANGQAAFSVSSTTIGPVVFTATSVTDNVTLTQTANVEFTDPDAAVAFNVNFLDEGQAEATNLVGVVGGPGETWNQGTMSLINLVDSTGAWFPRSTSRGSAMTDG